MRVLFAIRADAREGEGGDSVQLAKTREALLRLRVQSDVAYGQDELARRVREADLVHVFNLQTPRSTLAAVNIAADAHKPVVLSTILWDPASLVTIAAASYAGVAPRVLLPLRGAVSAAVWTAMGHCPRSLRDRFSDSVYSHDMVPAAIRCVVAATALLPNSWAEACEVANIVPKLRQTVVAKSYPIVNGVDTAELDDEPKDIEHRLWYRDLRTMRDRYSTMVLEVARCDYLKNQAGLIRALWHDRSAGIVLAGPMNNSGRYTAALKRLAEERGGVLFLGNVSREDLGFLYRFADVHVLPSWRETPGLVTLEAAACGCPTVSTTRSPFEEYLGGISVPVDVSHSSNISAAITEALQLPREHWQDGAVRVRSDFTWEKAATQTAYAYEKACGEYARH